jgi:chromosome segregation ATPase
MSDYEKLKKILEETKSIKDNLLQNVTKINEMYEIFENMNNDCDEELDEIDDAIEGLKEDIIDGEGDNDDINKEIEELLEKRKLIEEAVDLLDELDKVFLEISDSVEGLNIG